MHISDSYDYINISYLEYDTPTHFSKTDQEPQKNIEKEPSDKAYELYISEDSFQKYRQEILNNESILEEQKNQFKKEFEESLGVYKELPNWQIVGDWVDRLYEIENEIYRDIHKKGIVYGFTDIVSISAYAYSTAYQELEEKYKDPDYLKIISYEFFPISSKEEEIKCLNEAYKQVTSMHILIMNSLKYTKDRSSALGIKYLGKKNTNTEDSQELERIFEEIRRKICKYSQDSMESHTEKDAENTYNDVNTIVSSVLSQNKEFCDKLQWLFCDLYKIRENYTF